METKTQYTFGISTKYDELRIHSKTWAIIPAIKFVRKERKKFINKKLEKTFKITVPFEFIDVKRSRSWLGSGMQSDDINCHSEWEVKVKSYDKELLSKFIIECFKSIGIDYKGNTKQIL